MPQVLDGIEIWTFRGRTPPVNAVLLKEGLCPSGRVLRVVILNKPVIRKLLSDKGNKCRLYDVAEEISIHDAIKDANLCSTMFADSRPNMYLQRMLWFGLSLRRLVDLFEADVAILCERDRALVAENCIVESVATFQDALSKLQPLRFVHVPNELTVASPL